MTHRIREKIEHSAGGIKDLIEGRYERFNADFARVQPEVEDASDTAGLVVVGFQAHLGNNSGPHAISDLDALKVELNQFSTRFEMERFRGGCGPSLADSGEHLVAPVNIDMTLKELARCRCSSPIILRSCFCCRTRCSI